MNQARHCYEPGARRSTKLRDTLTPGPARRRPCSLVNPSRTRIAAVVTREDVVKAINTLTANKDSTAVRCALRHVNPRSDLASIHGDPRDPSTAVRSAVRFVNTQRGENRNALRATEPLRYGYSGETGAFVVGHDALRRIEEDTSASYHATFDEPGVPSLARGLRHRPG